MIHFPTDEEVLRYGRARGWPPMLGASDFRVGDGAAIEANGVTETTTSGTTLTSGSTANTKGAWSQISSSTTRDYVGFYVFVTGPNSTTVDALIDLGVGASGSEIPLISNIPAPRRQSGPISYPFFFPIDLLAGTRLSARGQSGGTSSALGIIVHGVSVGFQSMSGFSRAATWGVAFSGTTAPGTSVGTFSGSNTKTAWTQLSPALAQPCQALLISLQCNQTAGGQPAQILFDIGIGSAGSEQVLVGDLPCSATGIGNLVSVSNMLLPISLPAGTRISARAQASSTTLAVTTASAMVFAFD